MEFPFVANLEATQDQITTDQESVNHTMKTSPGALSFYKDIRMDVPFITNLQAIQDRRQQLIDTIFKDTNPQRTNRKQIESMKGS